MPRILGYDISITGRTLLGPLTILDGQSTWQNLITMPVSGANTIEMEYSIQRNTDRASGMLIIASNSLDTSLSDTGTDLANIGVEFQAVVSGLSIIIQYRSEATGFGGVFKYFIDAWN